MGTGKRLADKLEPAGHSKLPWKWVDKIHGSYEDEGGIVDPEGKTVLWLGDNEYYYPSAGYMENDNDAEYIVEACNNYYAMRAALEVIADNSIEQFVVTTARNALDSLMLNPAPGDTE